MIRKLCGPEIPSVKSIAVLAALTLGLYGVYTYAYYGVHEFAQPSYSVQVELSTGDENGMKPAIDGNLISQCDGTLTIN